METVIFFVLGLILALVRTLTLRYPRNAFHLSPAPVPCWGIQLLPLLESVPATKHRCTSVPFCRTAKG